MAVQSINDAIRLAVFRTDKANADWLYKEMQAGNLRQGWGAPKLALEIDGTQVNKADWEAAYRELPGWGDPSRYRYAYLRRMLDLREDDIVVVPKMPQPDRFTIMRVSGNYQFKVPGDRHSDFGHIIPVCSESMHTFHNRADDVAYQISGLFGMANHRGPVTFCTKTEHVAAARLLLSREEDKLTEGSELSQAAVDEAFRAAANSLLKTVATWNGSRFEQAVRQAFRDQGYEVEENHRHYDRRGGDADVVASLPARHEFLPPQKIAVQVKWKQGVDRNDTHAIEQITKWSESQGSDAVKFVISSADEFTEDAIRLAAKDGVVLIGGLKAMCFLLGEPQRYHEDWDSET